VNEREHGSLLSLWRLVGNASVERMFPDRIEDVPRGGVSDAHDRLGTSF
jgi:hypothetical protein